MAYSRYHVCIINGYPKANRDELRTTGVAGADDLFRWVLERLYPGIKIDVLMIADLDVKLLTPQEIAKYHIFIWTGSNLTIYHHEDPRVTRQIEFCRTLFDVGVPQYGSCWSVQMAAVSAGGEVKAAQKGREWFLARDIQLTEAGRNHPMYKGKPSKFDGFVMHLDEVTRVPEGGTILASNAHSKVHALQVKFKNGIFWAQQYHPEYTLDEMAKLLQCRSKSIVKEGHVPSVEYLSQMANELQALSQDPENSQLRTKWEVSDDVLDNRIKECEIRNVFEKLVFSGH